MFNQRKIRFMRKNVYPCNSRLRQRRRYLFFSNAVFLFRQVAFLTAPPPGLWKSLARTPKKY